MDFQRLLTFFFPFLLARVCGRRNHIPSNTTRDWSVALCSRPPYTCSPQQITFPSDWISHIRRLSFYSNIHVALRSKKYDNDGGVCVCKRDGEYGNKKWKPSAQFVVFCNWQIQHTIFIFFTCGLHENGIEKKKEKTPGPAASVRHHHKYRGSFSKHKDPYARSETFLFRPFLSSSESSKLRALPPPPPTSAKNNFRPYGLLSIMFTESQN